VSALPAGWEEVSLGEVVCPRSEKADPATLGDMPFIGMDHIEAQTARLLGTQSVSEMKSAVSVFLEGDILYGRLRPYLNKVYEADFDGAASAEFIVIPPSRAIDRRYLAMVMRRPEFVRLATKRSTGDRPRVKFESLSDYRFPLPPVAEQKRIVARTLELSARGDRARDELARVEKLASQFRRALLAKAFRGGLVAGHGDQWDVVPLGDLADVGTGATPKRGNALYYEGGTIPWITSGAVNLIRIDRSEEFITELALRETNCKVFPAGTLILAMYGEGQTRGRVARLDIDAATNQAVAAIQIREDAELDEEFVFWFLTYNYLSLRERAEGGVQQNLNLGIVKALKVPHPTLAVQEDIVRRIVEATSAIDCVIGEARQASRLNENLARACVDRALRGDLVAQDPDDEPVDVVLEILRAERADSRPARRGRGRASKRG